MLREIRYRIRALFRRRQLDRDLQDELADHLARRGESGRAPFGNITLVQEQTRDVWTFTLLEDLARDLRHALRTLRNTPAQTAAIVLLLAISIGATSAIFSVVNAALLSELPVADPKGLVVLNRLLGNVRVGAFSTPSARELQRQIASMELAASGVLTNPQLKLSADAGEEIPELQTSLVSGNFFQLLGVQAALGRVFTAEDDRYEDPHAVVVLSHQFWRRYLGADRGVIGRQVYLHNVPFTVVGVMPESFRGMGRDFWVPLNMQPVASGGEDARNNTGRSWLAMIGRLKPGISRDQARSELEIVFNRVTPPPPGQPGWKLSVDPGNRSFVYASLGTQYASPLWILMGAVTMLLLVACANVASILLARAGARQQEVAVRQAIGCGRSRLVRQFLTESSVLAAGGAGLGLLVAAGGSQALVSLAPPGSLDVVYSGLDGTVLWFTFVVSILSALLFGVAPALRASRLTIEPVLKGGSRGNTDTYARLWMNRAFVVTQAALSMILVMGAALFAVSLYQLYHVDPGYSTSRILSVPVNTRNLGYQVETGQYAALAQRVVDRLVQVPGVQFASVSAAGFLSQSGRTTDVFIDSEQGRTRVGDVRVDQSSRSLLETMGIPVLAGRAFQPGDRAGAPPVAIVNEQFVRQHFQGRNPVGSRVWFDNERTPAVEVIGVAGDAKLNDIREQPLAIAYLSIDQFPYRFNFINIRTEDAASAILPFVGQAIREVEPRLRPSRIETLATSLDRILSRDILLARISGLFGAMALLVACFGVYGMISYVVAERTREIGIRLALGAEPWEIRRRMVADALKSVVLGLLIGIIAAVAGEKAIRSLLFGVQGSNPYIYAAVAACLILTSASAAWLPARRAGDIDPAIALRSE